MDGWCTLHCQDRFASLYNVIAFFQLLAMMEREEGCPSLRTHLIRTSDEGFQSNSGERLEIVDRTREIVEEIRRQLWLAGPLVAVSLLQYCLQVISIMVVGHLGELALSSASLATSFAVVTGFSLLLGLGSALDTLCGQAYGAKQYHMLGIHMQRAMLTLLLASVPLAFIWAYAGHILISLGQDQQISMEAEVYARWMVPSLFAYGLLQCLVKFLQTQNIVFPMVLSSGVTVVAHCLVCWILVFKSGLGSKGAAAANCISNWINVLLLVLYVKFSPTCKKTWTGFSKEAFHGVLEFLRLGIPSAVMVCCAQDCLIVQLMQLGILVIRDGCSSLWSSASSKSRNVSIINQGNFPIQCVIGKKYTSDSVNTMWVVYMIPFGLSSALSTRVSNELGAGQPKAARLAACVAFLITITEGVIVGSTSILVRNIWGYLYSNEEEVVKYVARMMPVLATSNFLDGIQCLLSGIARGCGWQKMCAFVNLGAYYGVGLPCAVLFAFVFHINGVGLWMGIVCGLLVQVVFLLTITFYTDWNREARKARDRVCGSNIAVHIAS